MGPAPERHIDVFGGVDNDVRWMSRGLAPAAPWAVVAGVIDMPFSFVGDLITLPWTAYHSLIAVGPGQTHDTQSRRGPEIQ